MGNYKDPRRKVGSQNEIPSIEENSNTIIVKGYQNFTIDKTSLVINSKSKFEKINKVFKELRESLDTREYNSFCDIGCSSGIVSILAYKNNFKNIVSIDHDPEYIGILQTLINKLNITNINTKLESFGENRGVYDVVFCGAIIHWVWSLTSDFTSFEKIFEYLTSITNKILLIEWINERDHAIRGFGHITKNKENYTTANFDRCIVKYFKLIKKIELDGFSRILYVVKKCHHQ
jgi:SAM-dependent methyltransferase